MASEVDTAIGFNLRSLRKARGVTQEDLGGMCHDQLSSQQVSKYELGENQLSAARLVEFCGLLSCKITDFFVGVPRE